MDETQWAAHLLRFSVPVVCERIPGIPAKTVYAWQSGHRSPPEWQQTLILKTLGDPPSPATADPLPAKKSRGRPRKDSPGKTSQIRTQLQRAIVQAPVFLGFMRSGEADEI